MVYALYSLSEQIDNDIKEVQKAFATGKARFIRWGFSRTSSDFIGPEVGNPSETKIIALLRMAVDDPKVLPFHTDEEVHDLFITLLHEKKPIRTVWTSNSFNQSDYHIQFPPL